MDERTVQAVKRKIEQDLFGATCFVHYTSREVLCSILKNQELWLSCATDEYAMNDPMDIRFGVEGMKRLLRRPRIRTRMEACYYTLTNATPKASFEDVVSDMIRRAECSDVYLSCFANEKARENGALSMWTRYANQGGVAIFFNKTKLTKLLRAAFCDESRRCTFHPVLYADTAEQGLCNLFDGINGLLRMLQDDAKDIKMMYSCNPDEVINQWKEILLDCMVIQKNAWYREENEYRFVVACEKGETPSDAIATFDRVYIRNQERRVCKIHFDRLFASMQGREGVAWKDIIDRILIWTREGETLLHSPLRSILRQRGIPLNLLVPVKIPFQ